MHIGPYPEQDPRDSPREEYEENGFLTPCQVVTELDKYVIGQMKAKRAVAIALRNRWRRTKVPANLREEIMPNNIIMIGPTGVGKTEIARRIARLSNAPFVKVEASKFTEVGYVGRDVESMIRDLAEISVSMVRQERETEIEEIALKNVEEKLLDLLLPPIPERKRKRRESEKRGMEGLQLAVENPERPEEDEFDRLRRRREKNRLKLKELLDGGKLEDREVEVEMAVRPVPFIEVLSPMGLEDLDMNLADMLEDVIPKKTKKRRYRVHRRDRQDHGVEGKGRSRRLPRGSPARSPADHRGLERSDEIRARCNRPHPLHRSRGVSRVEARRSHPRDAGPLPDTGRARQVDRR
jgi:ATP-dependent protease HslVU ATPase subunit